jgi:hypothetical protein
MFRPVVPLAGYAGWTFLQRTRAAQEKAFNASAEISRETAYFKDRIGQVGDAEALVGDRRLMQVALGAFGLESDIGSRFFVKKVLEDGSLSEGALANRLSDKRYLDLTKAFGFDLDPPRTVLSEFGDEIAQAYRTRQFEVAVGETDENLRLAMGLGRDLAAVVGRQSTDNGRWFAVMGNPPLRKVFETALGLPASFGALDLELQLDGFRLAAERRFGVSEVADFTDPAAEEKLIRLFLLRADSAANGVGTSRGQIALSLLQASTVTYPRLF